MGEKNLLVTVKKGSTSPVKPKISSTSVVSVWFAKLTSTLPSYQLGCFSRC